MKNNIKSALIVHPHLTIFGGAEILLFHLTEELLKLGVKLKLSTLSLNEDIRKQFSDNIKFILPKKEQVYKLRSENFFAAAGTMPEIIHLRRLIEKEVHNVDIINIHNFPSTWAVDKKFGKPVVWTCNEPPALWNNPNPSFILKAAVSVGGYLDKQKVTRHVNRIIVSDSVNAERASKMYGTVPEIINYGIDYGFFSKSTELSIRREYSLEDSLILLHVGYFSPQKNQMKSIELLNAIKDKIPNAKILFAGQGNNEYEKKVRQFANENSLHDRILFLGHVTREKVRELYQASDIALFPTKAQGGWLSPFEAISAGIPIIVSPELTASSIITTNKLGYVSKDFTTAVIKITQNIDAEKQKVNLAQQWIKANMSWEKYTAKTLDVFNQVLNDTQ